MGPIHRMQQTRRAKRNWIKMALIRINMKYIYEYGHVPSNLTATDYDNADSMLPVEEGVTYQQCSLDDAGKQKLIFTQDAKRIYYTDDDGQSFDEIY